MSKKIFSNQKQILLYISITLYIIALTQKSYCTKVSCGDSIMALIMGPIGMVFGGATLTWLANPLLFISWKLHSKNYKLSLILSALATLLALSFLCFNKIIADEAGNYKEIISYGLGYWLWVSSAALMFARNLFFRLNPDHASQNS